MRNVEIVKREWSQMRWTVLGYQSPFPGPSGATPGYLLEAKGKRILIDCGSGILPQLAKIMPLHELDAVVLSHLHPDHFADIFVLQNAIFIAMRDQLRQKPLSIWTTTKPVEWFSQINAKQIVTCQEIHNQQTVSIVEGVDFTFYQTDHSIPCFAMKIDDGNHTILYGADSGPHTNWEPMGKRHDLVILEATFLNENFPTASVGHLSAQLAGKVAASMEAKQLLLTHVSPTYQPNQVEAEASITYAGLCQIASIGLTIEL